MPMFPYEVFISDPIPAVGALPSGDPMTWSPLASTMVFGKTDAVLVDPPFTREQTARVGDWIEASGKRLTRCSHSSSSRRCSRRGLARPPPQGGVERGRGIPCSVSTRQIGTTPNFSRCRSI